MDQRLSLITLGVSDLGGSWGFTPAHNPRWTVTDDGQTLLGP